MPNRQPIVGYNWSSSLQNIQHQFEYFCCRPRTLVATPVKIPNPCHRDLRSPKVSAQPTMPHPTSFSHELKQKFPRTLPTYNYGFFLGWVFSGQYLRDGLVCKACAVSRPFFGQQPPPSHPSPAHKQNKRICTISRVEKGLKIYGDVAPRFGSCYYPLKVFLPLCRHPVPTRRWRPCSTGRDVSQSSHVYLSSRTSDGRTAKILSENCHPLQIPMTIMNYVELH